MDFHVDIVGDEPGEANEVIIEGYISRIMGVVDNVTFGYPPSPHTALAKLVITVPKGTDHELLVKLKQKLENLPSYGKDSVNFVETE